MDAPPLENHLGADQEADRRMARPQSRRQGRGLRGQPAQVQGQLEARLRQFRRRLSRRVLAPLAARHGEPVRGRRRQGHVLLQGPTRTSSRCTCSTWATAITSRTSGRTWRSGRAALWAIEVLHPGMEHVQEKLRAPDTASAPRRARPRRSEPVNINVFPNLSLLGNHIQVFQPVSFDETNAIWYGTKIDDVDGTLGATCYRHQCAAHADAGGIPEFRRGRRRHQFRADPARPRCARRTNGSTCIAATAFPDRIHTLDDGMIKGPATDEMFMREYIREWKRLMKTEPDIADPAGAVSMNAPAEPRSVAVLVLCHRRVLPGADRRFRRLAERRPSVDDAGRARPVPPPDRTGSAHSRPACCTKSGSNCIAPECVYWVPSTPERRRSAHARSPSCSTTGAGWRIAFFGCARAMPGRRRRRRARRASSPMSRCSTPARRDDQRMVRSNFADQRILGWRDSNAVWLGRPPLPQERRRVEDLGEAGQPARIATSASAIRASFFERA